MCSRFNFFLGSFPFHSVLSPRQTQRAEAEAEAEELAGAGLPALINHRACMPGDARLYLSSRLARAHPLAREAPLLHAHLARRVRAQQRRISRFRPANKAVSAILLHGRYALL